MSRTDLIADTFTIVRNALMAKKENVDVPASKITAAIMEILKAEHYIDNFKLIEDNYNEIKSRNKDFLVKLIYDS